MHASQPIAIASSSKLRGEDASSRTAASPSTLRQASYNQRWMLSTSPMNCFGPLAMPDFNLKPAAASSIENEHETLIRMLHGDVMSMQEDMCRNYTCCGLDLADLHALVEHFEEAHVVVLDPNAAASSAEQPDVSGGFDLLDDMELDSPATPTSAFDTTPVVPARRHNSLFAPYPPRGRPGPPDATLAALRRASLLAESSAAASTHWPSACITPAMLFSPCPSESPSPLSTPAASRGASPAPSVDSLPSTTTTPSPTTPTLLLAQQPAPAPKPFRCPKPGCNKSYKQANGLKYHITHGQCNFAPRDPSVDDVKPYLCQVGCSKRFKNMSGLRYHYLHSGAHGQRGLDILAQSGAA